MRRRRRIAAGLVLLGGSTAGITGCDREPARTAGDRVRFDTVDGAVHVVSGNTGTWAPGTGWTVPDSGLVIGAVDGAPEYVFGAVAGLVVDRDGAIWVADTQAKEIRIFDRAGSFVRRIGREGEGPGEFRNLSGLAVAPDGVGALDGGLARVTVFDADGAVVRSFPIQRPYMIFEHAAPMAFDRQGRFHDRARFSTRPLVDTLAVVTYSPAGVPVDTAILGEVREDHLVIERDGRPVMSFPRPFAPAPSLGFGPAGSIYFSRGDAYRIDVLAASGDTVRVIRRETRPRPVEERERAAALEELAELYERAGTKRPPGIDLPSTKPAILRLVPDAAGNLWVLAAQDPSVGKMEWHVHDPDGRYLGAVATPVMNVMHIGADHVAGVAYDELGVQRVRMAPIRK